MFKKMLLAATILLMLLPIGKDCYADEVKLAWDASECTGDCIPYGVDGYKIYWSDSENGVEAGTVIDVGSTLTATIDVPKKTWIAATSYNEKGESGFSNKIFYDENGNLIQPATGGQISLNFVDVSFFEYFENYESGSDPDGWLDTDANNSIVENDSLFKIFEINGNKVFGSLSIADNIHSHLIDPGIKSLSTYEYSGKLMITDPNGGIGLTVFSDYPSSDAYYRLRQYNGGTLHIAPHPHGSVNMQGDIDSGVSILPNQWYNFRLLVSDTGSQTEIKAKVWNGIEPEWQVDCYDNSADRLKSGNFGIWTAYPGAKYFDDIEVK